MHYFKKIIILTISIISILFSAFSLYAQEIKVKDPENTLLMTLKNGQVLIELRPQWAPNHVERIKKLTRNGFYDNVVFHRVISGFMAQTGDPTGTGRGGSDLPNLKAEFNKNQHLRGTLSMARSSDHDSANSQFFICFDEAPFLDGQYTAFGQVIKGMEYVDMIKKGAQQNNGAVSDPDKIIKLQIVSDLEKNQ